MPLSIQIRKGSMVTKAEASILEYGADYSGGDTNKLIRYEMWVDASTLTGSETEIRGYQFDMSFNASEVGVFDFNLISGSNIGFNATNPANSGITFNSSIGAVAIASSTAIVDTNTANDGPPSFIGSEKLIGAFYLSPVDASSTTVDISITNILIVTDAGNIEQVSYTDIVILNAIPVANDDIATTDEDTIVIIDVLANDTDANGDSLTITSATANNGTVTINADGTLGYQGNQDFNGTDTITYTVDDGRDATDTAIVTVTVNAVNDQTIVANSTTIVDEDNIVLVDLVANATDVEGDALVITSASALNGTIINSVYTPNANFNGTDTITYTVNDSEPATVTVTVNSINDAPVANNDTVLIDEDTSVNINVLANDIDVDGDILSITSSTATNGTVSINTDGTLTYQGNQDFNGTDTITYVVY